MSKDGLGDRMKGYENAETVPIFMPRLPVCVRLDGKCFSTATKKLDRPYDEKMSKVMVAVTECLMKETNAIIGYTQSDEISLILYNENPQSDIYFGRKKFKIMSVLAATCTSYFKDYAEEYQLNLDLKGKGVFDCRAWQVPTKMEAVNSLVWREMDAVKNSIGMAARTYYSHKELHKKNTSLMQDMLMDKGINWNNYPDFFKRGTFIKKVKKVDDCNRLRRGFVKVSWPSLTKIVNKVEVVFKDEEPITMEK